MIVQLPSLVSWSVDRHMTRSLTSSLRLPSESFAEPSSPERTNTSVAVTLRCGRSPTGFLPALAAFQPITGLGRLDCQQAVCRERQVALPCCQLGLGRQRQQCGLAAANRAAASWRANRLNERRSTKVEWNVQCRLTGEHFEKIIVGNGHFAVRHERLLYGVRPERRNAAIQFLPFKVREAPLNSTPTTSQV